MPIYLSSREPELKFYLRSHAVRSHQSHDRNDRGDFSDGIHKDGAQEVQGHAVDFLPLEFFWFKTLEHFDIPGCLSLTGNRFTCNTHKKLNQDSAQ